MKQNTSINISGSTSISNLTELLIAYKIANSTDKLTSILTNVSNKNGWQIKAKAGGLESTVKPILSSSDVYKFMPEVLTEIKDAAIPDDDEMFNMLYSKVNHRSKTIITYEEIAKSNITNLKYSSDNLYTLQRRSISPLKVMYNCYTLDLSGCKNLNKIDTSGMVSLVSVTSQNTNSDLYADESCKSLQYLKLGDPFNVIVKDSPIKNISMQSINNIKNMCINSTREDSSIFKNLTVAFYNTLN